MSLPAKVTLLLLLTGLSLQAASAATESEAPAPPPAKFEIEGVSLGQSFDELAYRFDLSDQDLTEKDEGLRYIWRPPIRLTEPRPAIEGRVLRAIVFLFDEGRLVKVTASYASSGSFTRLGLEELYGEPTSVVAPPRRQTRSHRRQRTGGKGGHPVWIQVWTWEWEEATLTVIGEHYTDPNRHLAKGPDFFHFQLAAPARP